MGTIRHGKDRIKYLEERIQYLKEVNRFTLDTLEMAASLGNFQPSINKLQEPSTILAETRSRVQRLIPLKTLAAYLIEEPESEFVLASWEPKRDKSYLNKEIDGFETYKRILQLHARQRALVMTGYSETQWMSEAQRLGAGPYVRKPYTLNQLTMTVRKALEK
jgi:DNA-binding NarL/FixJ family response regulator